MDAVWRRLGAEEVVDSVFRAGLHPAQLHPGLRGDIWVQSSGWAAPPLTTLCLEGRRLGPSSGRAAPAHTSCAWMGDIWAAFSLCFLLSKEPLPCVASYAAHFI